jgi:hypothetical protein
MTKKTTYTLTWLSPYAKPNKLQNIMFYDPANALAFLTEQYGNWDVETFLITKTEIEAHPSIITDTCMMFVTDMEIDVKKLTSDAVAYVENKTQSK